jgi:hypothetical protein
MSRPIFAFACFVSGSFVLSRAVSSEPDFVSKKKFILSPSDDGRGQPAPSLFFFRIMDQLFQLSPLVEVTANSTAHFNKEERDQTTKSAT